MFDEGFQPLSPSNFFEIKVSASYIQPSKWKDEIVKKKYLLPDTAWLLNEERRLELHMGWSEEGLYFYAHIEGKFNHSLFPKVLEGDSLELFIDTRDRKTSGFNTKFCHHFYFLPQPFEGHSKGEITRFRTEDAHPLCEPEDLFLEATGSVKLGKLKIFIPASVLVGWNPLEFKKVGFSYRVNHFGGETEHFSAKTEEFSIEQEPSLWASCDLQRD